MERAAEPARAALSDSKKEGWEMSQRVAPRVRRPGPWRPGAAVALFRAVAVWAATALAAASGAAAELRYIETPSLEAAVAAKELPPVNERVPEVPQIVDFAAMGLEPGRHGGELNLLMAKAKDVRIMAVYFYGRLVDFTPEFELVPDILESFEVDEGRIFTFHLRPGHKWSDGKPFTAEDLRYFWEDVASNEELSPFGPPIEMRADGKPPIFEVLDELTVRYTWPQPNPYFLPALAGASPLFIYRPAHYLKKYHKKFVDAEKLDAMVKDSGQRNWAGLHNRKDRQYRFDNVKMPTLQPWRITTESPSERFVFERNPYYHRVDTEGQQLPYIDQVIVKIADSKIIPAKTGAGESDLQARYLRFDHYTFLKAAEKRQDFNVRLWRTIKGSQVALFPNLNAADDTWRTLIRDVRFRRALSLSIDRHEINQVIYYGLGREGNNTILEESPLFRPEYRNKWAKFDLAKANHLLDEIGLTRRDSRGIRLFPDGRPLEMIIDTAGESTEETDVLELIHDNWAKVGVKIYSRPSQREVFRSRVFSGEAVMSIWSGLDNGVPTADMSPAEFSPSQQPQLQWSKFGLYYESGGNAGIEPDMEVVRRLATLNRRWQLAASREERAAAWAEMLEIHADNVFTLGVVNGVPRPIIVSNQLRNVPMEGIYNWDPGAYFGMYKPDGFWFTEPRRVTASAE